MIPIKNITHKDIYEYDLNGMNPEHKYPNSIYYKKGFLYKISDKPHDLNFIGIEINPTSRFVLHKSFVEKYFCTKIEFRNKLIDEIIQNKG